MRFGPASVTDSSATDSTDPAAGCSSAGSGVRSLVRHDVDRTAEPLRLRLLPGAEPISTLGAVSLVQELYSCDLMNERRRALMVTRDAE